MADIGHRARLHGKIQIVESSLPPASKKKSSRRRQKAVRSGAQRPSVQGDNEPRLPHQPDLDGVAEAPEIVLVDKQSICVDILAAGYVQSFVDFFYLTHRPDPAQDAYSASQGLNEIDVSIEDMEVIKTHLVDAEAARRKPDQVDAVYSNLNSLASHFQSSNDQRTGVYFYEKCLEIARIMQDAEGEMKATCDLGSAYQLMKDYVKAAEYQEQHLKLAQEHAETNPEQVEIAYNHLKETYTEYGELLESEGRVSEAVTYHRLCLTAAQQTHDKEAEASAHYRLGRALVMSDGPENAAEGKTHLKQSLDLSTELGDIRGQGMAYSSLAALSQKQTQVGADGADDEALQHLKNFLRVSESTGNLEAQATACHNLGAIYNKAGRFDRAVEFFEQNYRLCRQLVKEQGAKTALVDKARINLGMAKGNQRLGTYLHIILHDVKSLLFWKNSRHDIR
eukprot:INCI11115.1.p1 GENE.INCI11115.1~~INCI11115.1.p1  ORF type:complete len:451 (-),score=78.34 INCI11115.1:41-1393(-)